jgi:transcriptional regulator with GAF, ATPase, and Fis domain
LRNICERLVIRARRSDTITANDVAQCGLLRTTVPEQEPYAQFSLPPGGLDIDELERHLVLEALKVSDWNQTEAARLLNISVDRMNNRVKKWNLKHEGWRVNK